MKLHPQAFWPIIVLSWIGITTLTSGCNLFDPIDSPTGDVQTLSAARACFDSGNFDCARELYAKLSGSYSDTATSELAFSQLDEKNAGMRTFIKAFGTGGTNAGIAITRLANSLISNASETTRAEFMQIFQNAYNSISDSNTKNMTMFVAATALAAEILAEDATDSTFNAEDLGPAACSACGCNAPSGKKLTKGTLVNIRTASSITGNPTFGMFQGAVNEIDAAVSALGSTGGIGSSAAGFSSAISQSQYNLLAENCYRGLLIQNNVGKTQ